MTGLIKECSFEEFKSKYISNDNKKETNSKENKLTAKDKARFNRLDVS